MSKKIELEMWSDVIIKNIGILPLLSILEDFLEFMITGIVSPGTKYIVKKSIVQVVHVCSQSMEIRMHLKSTVI